MLLATGVTNRRPSMTPRLPAAAVQAWRLRFCPVCDGFEVTDENAAVIGTGAHGAKEALFLRSYTDRVTLIAPAGRHDLSTAKRRDLERAAICLLDGPVRRFHLTAEGIAMSCATGAKTFEAVYSALGSIVHSDLARDPGRTIDVRGCVRVDAHQRALSAALMQRVTW